MKNYHNREDFRLRAEHAECAEKIFKNSAFSALSAVKSLVAAEGRVMKFTKIKVVSSVLGQEIGWSWPVFFLKCLIRKNALFQKIRQAKAGKAESDYDNLLALCAAAYVELAAKFGKEKAFEIMRKIIVPIGCSETLELARSLKLSRENPMAFLMSYFELVDKKGAGRFCKREIHYDDRTCHRVVTECPFHASLSEAGTPELTGLFCEVDREFYSSAFPEFRFHRNGSWENTIAYGKDHCEFVFELD